MGLDQALDISVSGIEAQRRTMELISSNIANISTTRTVYGGPYRRKIPVLMEKQLTFAEQLSQAENILSDIFTKNDRQYYLVSFIIILIITLLLVDNIVRNI